MRKLRLKFASCLILSFASDSRRSLLLVMNVVLFLRLQVSSNFAACTHRAVIQTGSQLVNWPYAVNHKTCATNATKELVRLIREGEEIPVTVGMRMTLLRTQEHQWKCTEDGDRKFCRRGLRNNQVIYDDRVVFVRLNYAPLVANRSNQVWKETVFQCLTRQKDLFSVTVNVICFSFKRFAKC